jgi:hypothetical protein
MGHRAVIFCTPWLFLKLVALAKRRSLMSGFGRRRGDNGKGVSDPVAVCRGNGRHHPAQETSMNRLRHWWTKCKSSTGAAVRGRPDVGPPGEAKALVMEKSAIHPARSQHSLVRKLYLAVVVTLALSAAVAWTSPAAAQAAEEATRVRILLVVDTQAANAKDLGVDLDGANIKRTLEENLKMQNLHKRYTLDVLCGAAATPDRVLGYYAKLKTNSSEGLVFYFTGHGMTTKDRGQALSMANGNLFRADLRAAMAQLKPRLSVILTDCCASFPNMPGANEKAIPPKMAPLPKLGQGNGSVLRHLLFQHRGLVDINAAKTGQVAWSNRDGGCFTVALTRLLSASVAAFDINRDGFVSWSEFYQVLTRHTQDVGASIGRVQSPMSFALGGR